MKIIRTKQGLLARPYAVKIRKKWDSRTRYGKPVYGRSRFGALDGFSGIYQQRSCKEGKITILEKFYVPTDTWSQAKQDAQDKWKLAVAAYKVLTADERWVYHSRAVGKHYTGYNLYIKEFMKS